MSKGLTFLGVIVIAIGIVASASMYTVHQTEQAIVLQFGKPEQVVREPGLKFKTPFVQNVIFYDRRVLDLDPAAEEMIAADKKRIVADSYARYRIVDPLKFFQTVGTEGVLRIRLGRIINASMRSIIGGYSLPALLTEQRVKIMAEIQERVNGEAKQFGIEVVDVRIRRADLPQENSEAIFARMRSEREREAKELRAEGAELGERIRAAADRDRTILLAEARKRAEELRGEGDGTATAVYNKAYGGQAREFYDFYRSMEAYRASLTSGDTNLVLSPKSEFFRFFGDIKGGKK
ncbi:MAG: protease modulator HflC [Rhodospirillales bacterium]|jgi:membrane protease subunit HflC|nr:protease modulator HflC [Rhodospirillales bacterium]MBT4007605.1 protease modulator HflC [Rhodospirillales bacterium]MBT5076643.1 protease modulator HflC [Rhodospirillales bacterium]MBT5113735.1 protease modulator HflC [Rhodospirillales bacterium]MBT5674037.1 protease modulator HflC [Rhodospirillales bacterium]